MSERSNHRRPVTFKLDDPGVIVMDPDDSSRPSRGTVHVTPPADPASLPVPIEAPILPQRGLRWGAVFWTALSGLILLGVGLGITGLIEDLFARSESVGLLGLAFAAAAALALSVVVAREIFGLARLAVIEKLHQRAAAALLSDDRAESRSIVQDLLRLAHQNPQLARARATPQGKNDDINHGGPTRLACHRRQSARGDRRAVRVRGILAPDPAAGAALRRTAGRARNDPVDASRGRTRRHHRRHGGERQFEPAGARSWHRGEIIATARRRHSQRAVDRTAWARRDRGDAAAAVCRLAATRAR